MNISVDSTDAAATPQPRARLKAGRATIIGGSFVIMAGLVWGISDGDHQDTSALADAPPVRSVEVRAIATSAGLPELSADDEPSVESMKSQLIGTWTDQFFGTRVLRINSDGSALMSIELDAVWALIYGSRLEFDATWTLEGDVLHFETTGGRPAKSAEVILDVWGRTFSERIIRINEDSLSLQGDDETKTWQRFSSSPPPSISAMNDNRQG